MGGVGKTTIAKVIYNQLLDRFDSCSFLKDIRETALQRKGLEYLQSLLISMILRCERRELTSVDEGTYELKHRLRDGKVLILLDDIDSRNQLNALAAELDWFGHGSRIIVTTRNRDVLPQVGAAYEVRELQPHQAFLLFCKHAFRNDLPSTEFVIISYNVVETTGGLPLALEVIGDLGREIVRQENYNEPGKRSRLWRTEEAVDALERQEGSGNVQAIHLNFGIELVDFCFRNEEFMNLSNLRFLQLDSANLAGDFRRLLSKLRCYVGS
ncbi:hypothetical protein CRG98_044881 [Punica granatum]|uniref:NB-ARC domain-containing protein n=1 Tax=Punica granatum TaxID=22663 RepID=A0A2I0HSN6_PUNGR|nr:hypothetical protein CRG98_044881 [Punica granatum]